MLLQVVNTLRRSKLKSGIRTILHPQVCFTTRTEALLLHILREKTIALLSLLATWWKLRTWHFTSVRLLKKLPITEAALLGNRLKSEQGTKFLKKQRFTAQVTEVNNVRIKKTTARCVGLLFYLVRLGRNKTARIYPRR